ncbi:hypothetical protein L1887_48912 [Cichorium endivia]|nr:hypothetical protein L1887_48912 [Cichorium endivia]
MWRRSCRETYLDTGVLARYGGFDEGGVTEDEEGGAAYEPKDESKGAGEPEHEAADDKEGGVEALLGDDVLAHLHGGDDDGIVARKVARVVRDALEGLVGVLRARDALVVKELAQRTQRRETLLTHAADPLGDCG